MCDKLGIGFVGLGALELALPKGANQRRVDQRDLVPGLVQSQGDAIGLVF